MSIKKIFAIFTSLTTVVMLMGPIAPVAAQSSADLQATINGLLATIAALQTQLNAQGGGSTAGGTGTGACAGITFTRSLQQGASGSDVKCLQSLLNSDVATKIAASGAGSPGNESTYFGGLTKVAVVKFQVKYAAEVLTPSGLTTGTGFVGAATRAKLNAMVGAGGGSTGGGTIPPITGGNLNIALAVENPVANYIPDGSLYNSMLTVKLTAGATGATVNSLTFNNAGSVIANTSITGLSVWDGATRLGNVITTLSSDGKVTFALGSTELVIPAGGSRNITLKADLATTTNSGVLMFGITSANDVVLAGGGTVTGLFPVLGNRMSIVDGVNSLGNVYVSSVAMGGYSSANAQVTTNGNIEVGTVQADVAKFKFVQNNSKEDIRIERLVVYFEGSLNEGKDLGNFTLYSPEGTQIATGSTMKDRYVTFILATPYVITKGLTKELTVRADVLDGATRYYRAQLQNSYDMMIKGANSGAYISPLNSDGVTYVDGTSGADANSYFRIKVGALTISKLATSASGAVAPSQTDISLAKYSIKSNGEKVDIRKIGVYVKVYAASATHMLSGTLKIQDADTGVVYASVSADTASLQNTTAISGAVLVSVSLSNYITIESGTTKNIEIRGNIPSGATTASTYQAAIGGLYVKRYSSNDYTYLPDQATSYYSGNQLTTGGVSLSVNKNASFTGVRTAKSKNAVTVGDFVLGASVADDLKISTIKVIMSTTTGVQNVYLTDEAGVTLGTLSGSPTLTTGDNISVNLTVAKSTTKRVLVKADITSAFLGTSIYASIAASGIAGYGVLTATTLSSTPVAAVDGNAVTVGTPTLTIARNTGADNLSRIILPSESGVTLDMIEFKAGFENLTLDTMTLSFFSATTTGWSPTTLIPSYIQKLYIYDGNTLVKAAEISNGSSTISGLNVVLPADDTKVLTIKADIADVNAMGVTPLGVGGIKIYSTSTDFVVQSSAGVMTDAITMTNSASSSYFLFTLAAPQITNASTYNGAVSGVNADAEVGRFTITNSGKRDIIVSTTTIAVSFSGLALAGTSSNFRLYDASDNLLASNGTSYSSSSPSGNISFTGLAQTIGKGGSKTFVVKADTTNARVGISSGAYVYLTVKLAGSKGYLATDVQDTGLDEAYWADGVVSYSYTNVSGTTYANNYACDTTNVDINNSHPVQY
ncbi:MAG: hypothetical protein NTV62_01940 [Candidatus Gribaldobacteria bacterium]|nr:hypothetical protein [Candidatus Gribaldobacteria bacterium]